MNRESVRSGLKLRATPDGVGHAPRLWPVWIAAPVVIALASALAWLLYQRVRVSPAVLGAAPIEVVKTTLTLVLALGAVLTGVYAYRKQRLSEGDAARADADQLTQRYSSAAEQLGHNNAAVRLAGVYAMARLADDWPKQRQQCIDVLCAYLRISSQDDPVSEREVRATIVRTLAAHLRDHSAISWGKHDFDLTGATLYGADFQGVTFSGEQTRFDRATFDGRHTHFDGATFSGKDTSFEGATFCGRGVVFRNTTFSGDRVWFAGATFSEDAIFDGATFSGRFTGFAPVMFSGEDTNFDGATFSGERTTFNYTTFSGANTSFDWTTFCGEGTSFDGTTFSGANISFDEAIFSGRRTRFNGQFFFGGTTADEATAKASFIGDTVDWGPITPRALPSPAAKA